MENTDTATASSGVRRRRGRPLVARPTYETVHSRLHRGRGPAWQFCCVDCGGPASEWSYDNSCPDELVDARGLRYSINPDRYAPRCSPCHAVLDRIAERLSVPRGGRKLTDAQVLEIRAAYAAGESCWSIARRLGVSENWTRDVALYRVRRQLTGGRVAVRSRPYRAE